jgi:hypothetical protein
VRRTIGIIVLGLFGFIAAVSLTLGALALAGDDVGTVVQPDLVRSSPTHSPSEHQESESPSPSADDHGGSEPSSGGEDHPGSGGSDDAGSNSGPGSSNSGPGSGDD